MTQDNAARTDSESAVPRQALTAANMTEALSFLIRIARGAGMQDVAANLVEAQKELQAISAQADPSDQGKPALQDHRNRTRLTRPN